MSSSNKENGRYQISAADLDCAVRYVSRKAVELDSITYKSWVDVPKIDPASVSEWCNKNLDSQTLERLKGAIRASRLTRKKAELRSAATSNIKVSAKAHEVILAHSREQGISIADYIDRLLNIEN